MPSFQDAGARYLELGFRVLPVNGKEGFIKGGWKAAASTREEIDAYWAQHPGANLALVLPPDRCILDIDPRNGATEAPANWPDTPASRTGGGGFHLYFSRDPARKLKHTLGPGLDILGDKAQAVEWPSQTAGKYQWFTGRAPGQIPYAPAPEAFYQPPEAPRKPKPNGSATHDRARKYCAVALSNRRHELARVTKGGRNAALNEAALSLGHLAHFGAWSEDEAKLALRGACHDNGLIGDDGIDSFDMTFSSGWEAGVAEPKELPKSNGEWREIQQNPPAPKPAGPGMTAAALAESAQPPLEWLIPGVLPIGAAMIAGKAKIGKSWLVLDIGLSVAMGSHVFGKIQAVKADVVYLALEDGWRRLQSRQHKLLGTAEAPTGIEYFTSWPTIDEGMFAALGTYLDEHPACRLVIVDTLGRVRGRPDGKKGIFQQDYSDLGAFQEFARLRRICLLIVHHARKQSSDDAMDQISGTTAIQAAVDTLLLLTRRRGSTAGVLTLSGKDIEEEGEFALDFDKLTGRWNWLGEAVKVKTDTDRAKVSNFLAEQTEPQTPTDIATELNLTAPSVRVALHRLKKDKAVHCPAKGIWAFGPE